MDTDNTQAENEIQMRGVLGSRKFRVVPVMLGIAFLFSIFYFLCIFSPSDFPKGSIVVISSGENLKKITQDFKQKHIIKSAVVFQSLVIVLGGEKRVMAGDYLLQNSENAVVLAYRIVHGDFGMSEVKVTIPEGFSVADISNLLEQKLVRFNRDQFLKDTQHLEGYLFPDTYFFPPTASSSDIVLRMKNNFNMKIEPLRVDITQSGHSESDIVKMASILEGEATSTTDRQIVAGILWNRIKQKLPLQVDATFKYINGKTTETLTLDDLKINSPYNTYVYRGLPPTPINNPGIDSISAAMHPIQTKYMYFLTGKDGVMHYAVTFDEHKNNKEKYLR